jgi:hypothetical protein
MDTAPLPPPKPPRKRPVGLIVGAAIGGTALVLCLCGIGSAIGLNARDGANEKRAPAATPATPSESLPQSDRPASPSPTAAPVAPAPKIEVPNVVGKRLTDAQAQLKALGFTKVTAADATGQGRVVFNPDNWLVRSQLPPTGSTVPVNARLTLNVSKPSDGQSAGPVTVGVVPNVVCLDLQAAQDTLQAAGFTRLASRDGTGAGRVQIIDRNWLVIAQSAAAGSRPDPSREIALTVVKYGEPTGASGCKS